MADGAQLRISCFCFILEQPARSTQPGYPHVGRSNEFQPKGGDVLWLGSKGRYGSLEGGM